MNREKDAAIQYLERDRLFHINIIEILSRETANVLRLCERGALVFDSACDTFLLTAEDAEAADYLIDGIAAAPEMVVAHQAFYIPQLEARFRLHDPMVCHQAAWFHRQPMAAPESPYPVVPLQEEHVDAAAACYRHPTADREYLLERIRAGCLFGMFDGGRLVGMVGEHGEGSMGFLEVLPEYRRRHLGAVLVAFMVNRTLAEGRTPFAQIVQGNEVSLRLNRKLGFAISTQTLVWLFGDSPA